MLPVLLTGGDTNNTSKIRRRVSQIVVIDVWSIGVPATGVLVGTGAGKDDTFRKKGGRREAGEPFPKPTPGV